MRLTPSWLKFNFPLNIFEIYWPFVAALLSWLDDLAKYGFVLLENAPAQLGPVADLQASRIVITSP